MYRKIAKLLLIAFDNLEGRQVYRSGRFLEKSQWARKDDLRAWQLRSLKALLKHAYENVPYYHESFRNAGFKPADLRRLEDARRIPVLRRAVVRRRFSDLLARGYPKKELILCKTSGTTASPAKFYRSKSDFSWAVAAELRGYSWAGYEVGDKIGLVWSVRPEQRRSHQLRLKRLLERTKNLDVYNISEDSMLDYARKMHRFKPDFIRGYAASTNLFASFLNRNRQFKIQPRAVLTTGETLRPHYRKNISEAFNCSVYDYYASNEMSQIAIQCGNHEGLHVTEENVVLEIVKDGEQTMTGEEGQILLTNLHNYAMPFIRYEIGDSGKTLSDDCPCGRKSSLMKPAGRNYEIFAGPHGHFTYLRDAQLVLQNLPIQDFQIVQESLDEIVVKIAKKSGYTEEHTTFILEHLRAHGPAKIRVEFVDSIAPERTGKASHIVSKIKTKYT